MAIAAPSAHSTTSSPEIVDREIVVLLPDQEPEHWKKVTWGTATRVVWTVISVVLHLAAASSTPGWIVVLILLHLVWSITSIWRDTHG
ncbi:hypothetical protein [Brevifollis gellanilyticus]|uniref:Uncharacterized protein n=1 Tax=Brevifollis gellanilyticus TaxID=748831 RepID=A0A512M6E9_9BACT|nr:hypothetical protein [Brevifollis gellanilyticus]GEP41921.1 hypothetical protein BGE01nite_12120 [Brevifollis gellanilyticus]